MAVSFHNADIHFTLPAKPALKKFIVTSFGSETGKKISITYVFCSDEYLLGINRSFLQHDYYTDIITFPLSETEKKTEAEIYISIDRIRDNASKHQVSLEHELLRVIFHGVLHLVGYKDKTTKQKQLMRSMEDNWIKAFQKASMNS